MNFLYNRVKVIATGKWIVILLFLFFLSITLINGDFIGEEKMKEYSNGVGILDKEFNYTPQRAYNMLESQGQQGREKYMDLIIYQDFLFPIIYSLLFLSLITYLLLKLLKNEEIIKWICLIPLLGGSFDWFENMTILKMLIEYPKKLYNLASIANVFSMIKTIIFLINIVLVLGCIILVLIKRLRVRKKATI